MIRIVAVGPAVAAAVVGHRLISTLELALTEYNKKLLLYNSWLAAAAVGLVDWGYMGLATKLEEFHKEEHSQPSHKLSLGLSARSNLGSLLVYLIHSSSSSSLLKYKIKLIFVESQPNC